MNTATFTFEAPEKARTSFRTVEIRETTGKDEVQARALVKAKGDGGNFGEELMKLSVVKLDGEAVTQPFEDFHNMTTRDRAFIGAAWQQVNSTPDELVASFLATSKVTV